MEIFDGIYDSFSHNNTAKQTVEKGTSTAKRKIFRTICDIANVERCRSEKLRKPSVVRRYRSVYLKKFVWARGVRHYCRYKKAFVIPVIRVARRPDNPFNVKTVVENLRRKQMTIPEHKTIDNNERLSVSEELCYSNVENRIVKTRNWEAIRYKYQLDYKERLKMERENYSKKCADMKKMSQKQHGAEVRNTLMLRNHRKSRPKWEPFQPTGALLQNIDERIKKVSYTVDEELIVDPVHTERQTAESEPNLTETHVTSLNSITNVADESKKRSTQTKLDSNVCQSIDLTENYDQRDPVSKFELKQMRYTTNECENNFQPEVRQNEIVVDSGTVIVPTTSEYELTKKSTDFDFSIPFNESSILVKVMAPDPKKPGRVTNQHRQTHSRLQNRLLNDTTSESKPSKHVALNEESKTDNIRPDSSSKSEWLQYIQHLLNKTAPSASGGQHVEKTQTYTPTSKRYFDNRTIPNTTTIQRLSVSHVDTTNSNYRSTKCHDSQAIAQVQVNRPVVSNPRLIRPKVVHPSPYYRSDYPRNNQLYNGPAEDQIVLNMPPRRHSPPPIITGRPSHMEYIYGNRPNYRHDFMVRSMQLPFDVSHTNLMGQPVYPPYDQAYMQYPIETERMPHPYDRFVQHNIEPPRNRSIGFMPPTPTASGAYRYLNPQHDHPLWIYPHMLER